MEHDSLIEKKEDFDIKTRFGNFRLRAYEQTTNGLIHLALTRGCWKQGEEVLVRVNSTLINNDILGTLTNNADEQLQDMFAAIDKEGTGAIVFINHLDAGFDLLNRLKALKENQKNGIIKAPSVKMDAKDFGIGAQILHDIGALRLKLLSNSKQKKRVGMIGYGLEIVKYQPY